MVCYGIFWSGGETSAWNVLHTLIVCLYCMEGEFELIITKIRLSIKAWFPYDRPSRLKKCPDDRDDHMKTLPRRLQTTRTTETTSIAWIELSSIRTIGTIM